MPFEILNKDMFPAIHLGYLDPDDYFSYNGVLQSNGEYRLYESLDELVHHVEQRRESLNFDPIPNLEYIIQEYIYRLGLAPSSYFIKSEAFSGQSRSVIDDVTTGAKLAIELSRSAFSGVKTAGGFGFTTLTEAEERATICVQCPNNIPITNKLSSIYRKARYRLATLFTAKRETSKDAELNECEVCSCPLISKVHYSKDVIREVNTTSKALFPEAFKNKAGENVRCWMRTLLEEDK